MSVELLYFCGWPVHRLKTIGYLFCCIGSVPQKKYTSITMNAPIFLPPFLLRHAAFPKRLLLLGLLFFCFADMAAGQVLFFDPGETYTNTDGETFDSYGPVNVSNCTTVQFSVEYNIPLGWEGSGNMETSDECGTCNGNPTNQSPDCITTGAFINGCWDFLWVRFFIDGIEVGGDLIGEAGTTDAEASGTITLGYCTNGTANNASIQIVTQTWAMFETISFSNITITCIDDSPTLAPIGPLCQNAAPVALSPNQGGVAGTWMGNGVAGNSFNPAVAGPGSWTLTFTALPGECAGSATTTATVTPLVTPALTPLGPYCQSNAPVPLFTTQNGITGTWMGPGVTGGNTFNPATAGTGVIALTFNPNPGQCANPNTLNVTVNPSVTPALAPLGPFCTGDPAVPLSTTQSGITGNWVGSLVVGNVLNPAAAGNFTLTFNPNPGQCANPNTLMVQVTPAVTPMLTPQGPFCGTDPPASLPAVQSGITGSWSGNGVTGGNTFNPALPGSGTFTLTFNPAPGQCANPNTINVTVSSPLASPPGQLLRICYTLIPFSYTDNLPAILSAINNGTGQQVNWYLDAAGNNPIDPTDPADIQALILGGPNQTVFAAVFNGTCESATVPVNVLLTLSTTPNLSPQGPFCQGGPPASLPTNQSGIAGSWLGPGVSGNTFNPSVAGNFTLTFTPNPGQCASPNTLTVNVSPAATPNLTPVGPFCQSAPPASLSTNQGGVIGSWSGPGVSGNTFNPAAAGQGTFTLTFTPNPGQCANPNTLNVTVGNITANNAGPLTACDNGTGQASFNLASLNAQVNPGAGTVNWYFSPNATNPINNPVNFMATNGFQVYAAAFDGVCQSATVPVQLIVLPIPVANPFTLLECEGPNGMASFNLTAIADNVNGGAPTAVSWSFDPAGNTSVPNPAAFMSDDITVYAIVFNGSCRNSAPVNLIALDAPSPALAVGTPISCNGSANGSLQLTVSGGQLAYFFDWNVNALDGIEDPSGLGPGSYSVTVIDDNGCTGSAAITLTQPALLAMACSVDNPVITPGGAEGEASVSFNGGTAPFSISWAGPVSGSGFSPTPGTILLSDLEEGTYVVTVLDARGCTTDCTFTVNGPGCSLQLSFANQQDESCPGESDGAVEITIAGGTAPYTINWSDGPVDVTSRTGLAAGAYTVTVDDSGGCQLIRSIAIGSANPAPQATISSGDTICSNECITFDMQFQGTPPFILEYAVDTGVNRQFFNLSTTAADTVLEICASDFGYADGPLEVLFSLLSDANCIDTFTRLEVVQVQPAPAGIFNVILCPGDSLVYNGTVYNTSNLSGTEALSGAASNGCDSLVAVGIAYFTIDTTLSVVLSCDPAQAGRDTALYQSSNGCDSVAVTETLFVPADTTFLTDSSCDPSAVGVDTVFLQNAAGCDSLVITETFFDANAVDITMLMAQSCDPATVGVDTVFLQNLAGCDSLVITETVLLPSDETFLSASSCDPSAVGVDTVFLQNTAGCDSLVITETAYIPGDETFLSASSCDPSAVGVDTVFLQNLAGCDSLVITETAFIPGDETFLSASSCDPSVVGVDTVFLQNLAGCDSLVITETVLLPSDETFLSASSCDPSAVGVDTVFLQNLVGCDSLVITETALLPGDETFLSASSCDPSAVGVDTVFLQNLAGCDSLVITETVLLPGNETFLSASSCDPAAVGVDTVFLQNLAGCDSLVITETILLPSDETFLMASSCDPSAVGVDTVFLQNLAGCDSLVITETVLLPSDETFLMASSCDPSAVGVDTVFLQNLAGCDSLVITETVLLPGDETFLSASSCDPSAVGVDTIFLQNMAGCDSLVITETVLLPGDETFLMANSCDPSAVGVDTIFLQNLAGCDSLVITETVLLPGDETFLSASSCDPSAVGVDTVFLQNLAGCDSLVITETIFIPGDETFLSANSCDPAAVGVDTVFLQNTAGCDSLVITETAFIPGNETFLSAGSCDPSAVGVDTVFLQNLAGCDSLVITETAFIPGDETFLMANSCDPSAVGVDTVFLQNLAGCDSLVITETILLPTDTAFIEDQLCSGQVLVVNGTTYSEAFPVGTEVIPGGAANGCDSIIQVSLAFTAGATGFIEGGRAICPGEAVELTVRLQGASTYNVNISDGASVIESYSGISGDVTFTVTPSATTNYQISLLTAVGSLCPVEIGQGATVTVVQSGDIQAQLLTDYGGFGISCSGSQDGSVGVSAAQPGLSYQWNTGQSTPVLENVGAGLYTVTVTSTAGCSVVDSVRVSGPEAMVAKAGTTGVDCFNELSGSIQVESLEGGAGPYEYSLDGQSFSPLGALPAAISGLSAGSYTLYLQDANDCQVEVEAEVPGFEPLFLFLGADETIKLGDSVLLRPLASFEITAFSWSPLRGILDSAALYTYVKPEETTAYTLIAADSAGCSVTDQILVFVEKFRSVYAPNIFSPNEDGKNDFFTLFAGPEVAEIRVFRIFDRWGNLLFERAPFQPNVENLGWDGTFNGQEMDTAVFVFYAEVAYVDGFAEVVEGDFVLMR